MSDDARRCFSRSMLVGDVCIFSRCYTVKLTSFTAPAVLVFANIGDYRLGVIPTPTGGTESTEAIGSNGSESGYSSESDEAIGLEELLHQEQATSTLNSESNNNNRNNDDDDDESDYESNDNSGRRVNHLQVTRDFINLHLRSFPEKGRISLGLLYRFVEHSLRGKELVLFRFGQKHSFHEFLPMYQELVGLGTLEVAVALEIRIPGMFLSTDLNNALLNEFEQYPCFLSQVAGNVQLKKPKAEELVNNCIQITGYNTLQHSSRKVGYKLSMGKGSDNIANSVRKILNDVERLF